MWVVLFHPLLPCQALGQALIPLPSRERGIVGWGVLLCAPPCGYCLEASMTASGPSFPRRRESTGWSDGTVFIHPLLPCQALGQALIPLPSRERGFCWLVWACLPVSPPCGYCLKASMTVQCWVCWWLVFSAGWRRVLFIKSIRRQVRLRQEVCMSMCCVRVVVVVCFCPFVQRASVSAKPAYGAMPSP